MKYIYLLLCVLFTIRASAQTPDQFWQKRCEFKSDAKGIAAKYTIPCSWTAEKNKGNAIKTLQYEIDDDNGVVSTISIKQPEKKMTPERMDEIIKKDAELKDKSAKRLWARKIKIDGKDCLEVAIKAKKSVLMMKVFVYTVQYVIPQGDQSVHLSYAIIGQDDKKALQRFNEYKTLFYNLANATDFVN